MLDMGSLSRTNVGDAALGGAIPDTAHAVSVSLPSWKANIGYEEGADWVLSKLKNGYPRFFVHLSIESFADKIVKHHGNEGERALLFPSSRIANRCQTFIIDQALQEDRSTPEAISKQVRIVDFCISKSDVTASPLSVAVISAVLVSHSLYPVSRKFWQHSGDGVSSRRAEFFHKIFDDGHLAPQDAPIIQVPRTKTLLKGPKRYQKGDSVEADSDVNGAQGKAKSREHGLESTDYLQFVEERFGRNLDLSMAASAKLAIRRRIAGALTADIELEEAVKISNEATPTRHGQGFSVDDVYLWPTGMSAIFNTHRILLNARGPAKSIMFGFPYIDTLKILEKFGPGALFYGHGSTEDLDDLEARCTNGERFLALFCEFPGNPLLKTPDLSRIRQLADRFQFAVVVDETIGNFLNVNVLPMADVVVSSLTKIFSGDSNVMGGSAVLNPSGQYYNTIREHLSRGYEDHFWPEDAIFMERNSRDFLGRNKRINSNAEALCELLRASQYVKKLFYPKHSETRSHFEARRNSDGGYGGLFSLTFHSRDDAIAFFDAVETAKGPSLGTNFTLSSPFVILAHYNELEWAAQFGAEADLIRVSVGLEDTTDLCAIFQRGLEAVRVARTGG